MGFDVVDVAELPGVDPGSRRVPVGGPHGLEFVTFGAPRVGSYEQPSWG